MEKRRSIQAAAIIRSVIARFAIEIPPNQAMAVCITSVRISDDLKYADVSVSALQGAEAAVRILSGRVRDIAKTVASEVVTYATPMIRFHVDHRGEELDRLDKLIDRLGAPLQPKKAKRPRQTKKKVPSARRGHR